MEFILICDLTSYDELQSHATTQTAGSLHDLWFTMQLMLQPDSAFCPRHEGANDSPLRDET